MNTPASSLLEMSQNSLQNLCILYSVEKGRAKTLQHCHFPDGWLSWVALLRARRARPPSLSVSHLLRRAFACLSHHLHLHICLCHRLIELSYWINLLGPAGTLMRPNLRPRMGANNSRTVKKWPHPAVCTRQRNCMWEASTLRFLLFVHISAFEVIVSAQSAVQRSEKRFAKIAKHGPGRARQNRQTRAVISSSPNQVQRLFHFSLCLWENLCSVSCGRLFWYLISEMHPMIATDLSPAAIDHGNNFSIWIALIIEFAWTLEMTVKWHAPVFVNLLAILLQRPGLIAAFLLPRPRKPIAIAAISIQPVVVEPMPWTLAYRREWHEYRNCGRRDLDHRMRLWS